MAACAWMAVLVMQRIRVQSPAQVVFFASALYILVFPYWGGILADCDT
jgi:hypothetical protein